MTITVDAHLSEEMVVRWRVHPESFAAVRLEGSAGGSGVCLFGERPVLIRLQAALAEVITDLDAGRASSGETRGGV